MSALEGVTKEGKPSRHTLSNTGPRRFLVVEFDTGTPDEHAALLLHLAAMGRWCWPSIPATRAIMAGSFAWPARGQACSLYALRCFPRAEIMRPGAARQFCRMPDGTRDNGKRQTVFYFNPKPLEVQS